jgi:hypothetical protein
MNDLKFTTAGDYMENKMLYNRDQLTEMLRNNVCEVTFTKVNGEIRTMPCTLSEAIVPPAPVHITNTDNPVDFPKERKINPNTISAWCTDKKEWRSFRVANVTNVEIKNGANG